MVVLTVRVPAYVDFDGGSYDLNPLRDYPHLEDAALLVADNSGGEDTRKVLEGSVQGRPVRWDRSSRDIGNNRSSASIAQQRGYRLVS